MGVTSGFARSFAFCVLLAVGLGDAAGVAQEAPPERDVYMRELDFHLTAETQRTQPRSYILRVKGKVMGIRDGEVVRIEWKKGSRTVAQAQCRPELRGAFECRVDGELRTTGEHRLLINVVESTSDRLWTIVDAKPVIETARTMERVGDRDVHLPVFYVNHDDRMGLAYFHTANVMNGPGIVLYFWRSDLPGERGNFQFNFRCRQGEGEWQGFPTTSTYSNPLSTTQDIQRQQVNTRIFNDRQRTEERGVRAWWRERVQIQLPLHINSDEPAEHRPLGEGWWQCQYRENGVVVRGLILYITDAGRAAMPQVQFGRSGIPLDNRYYRVVNLTFPERATQGDSFDPAAMRASYGFGRPWPRNGEGMDRMFDALPRGRQAARSFTFPRIPRGIPDGDRARGRR